MRDIMIYERYKGYNDIIIYERRIKKSVLSY